MADVLLALLPALVVAIVFFGWRALTLTLVSIGACIAFETIFNAIMKRKNTVTDLSSAVTGMLLAFCLPVSVPYWLVVIGAFFAIIVVKCLFGGIGKNFLNPALSARAFLFSWPALMTTFTAPFNNLPVFTDPIFTNGQTSEYIDSITSATPLSYLKTGVIPDISISNLFFGNVGGCIGEVCTALLLLGGIYLLLRRVITWHIPVSFIGTVAVITFIFPKISGSYFNFEFMITELLSGGLILAAFFMATDYSTSPVTKKGKFIYGVGCGLLTVFLRYFSGYPEGVSYAILLMNVLAFSLDKFTRPRRYGTGGMRKHG